MVYGFYSAETTLRASLSGTFLQMKDVVNQYLDQYPNLSEGADRVGGQLRGDKECPFSGVTKSGRVWRRVPESDARSVRSMDLADCIKGTLPSE